MKISLILHVENVGSCALGNIGFVGIVIHGTGLASADGIGLRSSSNLAHGYFFSVIEQNSCNMLLLTMHAGQFMRWKQDKEFSS